MRKIGYRVSLVGLTLAVLAVSPAAFAQGGESNHPGAVVQSAPPPVPQRQSVPPLHLSDAQRAQIQQAVSGKDTEVTFTLKATKAAAQFAPQVGAKIPKGIKAHPLPRPLIYEIPELKRYTYLKLKGEVLLVDPMTDKVADMFPQQSR